MVIMTYPVKVSGAQSIYRISFAFLTEKSYYNFLAKENQMEVGTVFTGGANLEPRSNLLQEGLRFFHPLLPAKYCNCLTGIFFRQLHTRKLRITLKSWVI